MRRMLVLSAILGLYLTAPLATRAQVASIASKIPDLPVSVRPDPSVLKTMAGNKQRVNVQLADADAQKALTTLLNQTGYSYQFDPALQQDNSLAGAALDLPPRKVTMKLVNASVVKALDTLTGALGLGWTAGEDGGNITIHIVKLKGTVTFNDLARQSMRTGGFGGGVGFIGGEAIVSLPNTPVKIDRHDATIREALGDVLKQASIDFAVDDDVPADEKRSFTFENVTIRTALDVICQSAGLGWRAEQTPGGVLVRVGKRYASGP